MKHLLTLSLLFFSGSVFSQSPDYFLGFLKENGKNQVLTRIKAYDSAAKMDTVSLVRLLDEMKRQVADDAPEMKTRVEALSARLLFYKLGPGDSLYAARMKDALYRSYELDEPMMVAEYARWYGEMLHSLGKTNEGVQYALNSMMMQEQLGSDYFPTVNTFCLVLGEFLFRTANYAEAVKWLNKGLNTKAGGPIQPEDYANGLNTLALAHYRLKDYAQSLVTYKKCMEFSQQNKLETWYLIGKLNRISPFMDMGLYDSAAALLQETYDFSIRAKDNYSLGDCLFMMGRMENLKKNPAKALELLKRAEAIRDERDRNFRYLLDRELANVYEDLGQPESSLFYYKRFKSYEDSSTKAEAALKAENLMVKANYEKELLSFRDLKNKKEAGIRLRNAGIAGVVLLSAIGLFWLNRKRSQARKSQETAQKQLLVFTASIHEKDRQLEALQASLAQQTAANHIAGQVEELSRQMILTEEDWQRFQVLFNKTYPGFLFRLREKFTGITEAEIRMACLIKIRLSTRQIASMQGISPDSVHKTRHRLRQRFSTATTPELESIIDQL